MTTPFGYIYKITNLVNGKVYIGQTTKSIPKYRFSAHISESKRKGHHTPLHASMKHHGCDNFFFKTIIRCNNQKQLDAAEQMCIRLFRSHISQGGYNLEWGGYGRGKTSEEIKKKISENRKGKFTGFHNPNFGNKLSEEARKRISNVNKNKKHTKETRFKMSESKKGVKNPQFGKRISEEHKKRLRLLNTGKKLTDDHKQRISKTLKGRPSHKRKAVIVDGFIYPSLNLAATILSTSTGVLWRCLKGIVKSPKFYCEYLTIS